MILNLWLLPTKSILSILIVVEGEEMYSYHFFEEYLCVNNSTGIQTEHFDFQFKPLSIQKFELGLKNGTFAREIVKGL